MDNAGNASVAQPLRRLRLFAHGKAHYLAPFALYAAMALVLFYPVTLHILSSVPGSGTSAYQDPWMLWWSAYAAFTLHSNVFHTSLLSWPLGTGLASDAQAPLLGVILAPLIAVSAAFAYNTAFILAFALSGLFMYLLAEYLSGSRPAAFVAGIIFTFSAFHVAESSHLSMLFIGWLPLSVYFLLRMMRGESRMWVNVAGLSLSVALSTLTASAQLTILIMLMLAAVIIAGIASKSVRPKILNSKFAIPFAAAVMLALAIGSWNYVPLAGYLSSGGLAASGYYPQSLQYSLWSDNLFSYFVPSYFNGLAYSSGIYSHVPYLVGPDPTQRTAYIGYTVLALALYGAYTKRRNAVVWVAVGMVAAWLSLGPTLQLAGMVTKIPGLYAVYGAIPFLRVVREPARFGLIVTLSAAVLASFGFKRILERRGILHGRHALLLTAIACIAIFADIAMPPLSAGLASQMSTAIPAPQAYAAISNVAGNYSVLSLPALPLSRLQEPNIYSAASAYYTSATRKPLVGGNFYGPNATEQLLLYNMPLAAEATNLSDGGAAYYSSPVSQNLTNQTLLTLYNYNTGYITIQKGAYTAPELNTLNSYMDGVFGLPYADNYTEVFGTAAAINRSIYNSYVAYPVLTDWIERSFLINGSYVPAWSPAGSGAVVVYAPYANATARSYEIYGGGKYYAPTSVSFYAFSQNPGSIVVARLNGTAMQAVATIPTSHVEQHYSVNMSMQSGPGGTTLFFLPSNQTGTVYISSISFSRSG